MNHSCERVAQSPGCGCVVTEHLIFERPGADERHQTQRRGGAGRQTRRSCSEERKRMSAEQLDAAVPSHACCSLTLGPVCPDVTHAGKSLE